MNDWVRPTIRCLSELSIPLPDLGVLLHELEHPLLMRAQRTPELRRNGSAERIRSISDLVWFKVKTNEWRGAVGELAPIAPGIEQTWWMVAAGRRADDSPQRDFYSRLEAEAHQAGPNSCNSAPFLPTIRDRKRLEAEAATKAARVVRTLTRRAACESLTNGDIRGFEVAGHDIRVRLQVHGDGRAYATIGSSGGADVPLLVTVLSAFPGLAMDDWMPEPTEQLGLEPMPGEMLWSALMSPDAQSDLLEWVDSQER